MKFSHVAVAAAAALIFLACAATSKHESQKLFVLPPPIVPISVDIAHGSAVALQGTTNGAAPCSACHGARGEGLPGGAFPRLADEPRYYLASQLDAYRTGQRDSAVMAPIAKALSHQELEDVSAYYESLSGVPYARDPKISVTQLKRAAQLAVFGDQKLGLQSCQNCHGPGGIGEGPSIPYLKGQSASYIVSQLAAWKSGTRKTNPEHMGYIAKLINEADAAALGAYYQDVPNGEENEAQ